MQSQFLQINDFPHFRAFEVRRILHPRKNPCRPPLAFHKERDHFMFDRHLRRHEGDHLFRDSLARQTRYRKRS